jgi:hypothetical protein
MSNSLRGMIAGFVATLVLTVVIIIKNNMGLWPQLSLIQLLVNLGSITPVQAWMDHFIIGVVVWGLLFGAFDAMWENRIYWLKGLIFGLFAWVVMMILFMPLAKVGFFGVKVGASAIYVTLFYHLVYGLVLGVTYGILTAYFPAKAPERPTPAP